MPRLLCCFLTKNETLISNRILLTNHVLGCPLLNHIFKFSAIMCSKMEVHDTHSHEPVFCFSTIPAKKARCLEAARKHLLSSGGRPCRALLPCGQPPACLCWRRVSLRFQRGRTTSSGTDFLTQLSGRMLDLTKVYWTYTTFRRRTAWIPEVCSVGLASIEKEEKVFRQFGLPGFVTCMDGVHLAWELAPFMSRWQYKGKEGFPTVVVNVHCTATGRIVYCGPIFPGAHNDKTMVHYDKLVDAMRHDALFKDCKWSTCVPNDTGSTHELTGCMTLCDSGYHE